jgi:hypothetical protein
MLPRRLTACDPSGGRFGASGMTTAAAFGMAAAGSAFKSGMFITQVSVALSRSRRA